jgi:4-hydroxybenzoate polyprenyltransferase
LHSLAVRFGIPGALRISLGLHAAMLATLVATEAIFGLGWPFQAAVGVTAACLIYLHLFRRSASLDALNQDFFLANAAVSLILLAGIAGSVLFAGS